MAEAALGASRSVPGSALELARTWGPRLPLPGQGQTRLLWEALATVAAVDLSVARTLEPHVDALAILAESGGSAPDGTTWGVFAAEGPGVRLEAVEDGGSWTLHGTKPWCSLAGDLSHALVTAWTGPQDRRLFEVSLEQPGVRVEPATWHARGLRDIASGPVTFERAPARPVGESGWYLRRDGFAWGGLGVAAVWYGGAVGLARLLTAAAARRAPDQIALMHLGAVDARLHAARSSLLEAAAEIDAGRAPGDAGNLLAARVRQVVAGAAEQTLVDVGHALGPAPLALDPVVAGRAADLALYLRQHHAERDAAALGDLLLEGSGQWA
ncbi:MAG: acyl-CoA dehydrogenase family protein [Nocardioides sp.]